MTHEAISPLRRRMIEDMTIRKLGKRCGGGYGDLRAAGELFGWEGSDRSSRMTVKGLMSCRRMARPQERRCRGFGGRRPKASKYANPPGDHRRTVVKNMAIRAAVRHGLTVGLRSYPAIALRQLQWRQSGHRGRSELSHSRRLARQPFPVWP
jgi:hypothetical protein